MKRFFIAGTYIDDYGYRCDFDTTEEAETLEKAKCKVSCEYRDIVIDQTLEIGLAKNEFGPMPECCDKITKKYPEDFESIAKPVIRLVATDRRNNFIDPYWSLFESGTKVFFCPFCGKDLPKVKRKDPWELEGAIWSPHSQYPEDYCGTCDERNRCCRCSPPEVLYKII